MWSGWCSLASTRDCGSRGPGSNPGPDPGTLFFARKNERNFVVATPFITFKLPRDGNVIRIFKEFAIRWKAFLHGLAAPCILIGPVLVTRTVPKLLKDVEVSEEVVNRVIEAIKRLAAAGIEHRELRHPEKHVGFLNNRVVFLDFDHARLSRRSRDLNKFLAWVNPYRRRWQRNQQHWSNHH